MKLRDVDFMGEKKEIHHSFPIIGIFHELFEARLYFQQMNEH